MDYWKISGETGKALGETKVSLSNIGIKSAALKLASLEVDTLTFPQAFEKPADVANHDIDEGQIVELWRDGLRMFRGHCTGRRVRDTFNGGLQVDTTISGVWWWMAQTPLSGEINDQSGGAAERISFALPTGNLKAHITAIINRAIALGVPIALGNISECFDIPQITLKQMSLADAIAELMRWIPDAVAWIDYSGTGTPTFNVTRRDDAPVETLTVSQPPCKSIDINPRFELKSEQVVITYVKRGVDGKTIYAEQISGHAGTAQGAGNNTLNLAADASSSDSAYTGLDVTIKSGTGAGQTRTISGYIGGTKQATISAGWATNPDATSVYQVGAGNAGVGRRQIFTVSGPELDSFLPNDQFDSYSASTSSTSGLTSFVNSLPAFASAVQQGMPGSALDVATFSSSLSYKLAGSTSSLPSNGTVHTIPKATGVKSDGSIYSPSGYSILIGENPPDWLISQLGLIEITIRGKWVYKFRVSSTSGGSTTNYDLPDWWYHLPSNQQNFSGLSGFSHYNYSFFRLFEGEWESQAWIASSITPGTIYRDADYGFIMPPNGLAANLQRTQSFQPYEGTVGVADLQPGGTLYQGKALNINGSIPAHGAMKTMVQSVELDLATGRSDIYVGTPTRLSYQSLVSRFRRTASDNIVYLT